METSDTKLSQRLRHWRVNPPADAGFRNSVWQRIGDRAKESLPIYLRTHATAWTIAALVVLSAAAYTGHATAEARLEADREAMVVSYLIDLDPRVQAVVRQ